MTEVQKWSSLADLGEKTPRVPIPTRHLEQLPGTTPNDPRQKTYLLYKPGTRHPEEINAEKIDITDGGILLMLSTANTSENANAQQVTRAYAPGMWAEIRLKA